LPVEVVGVKVEMRPQAMAMRAPEEAIQGR